MEKIKDEKFIEDIAKELNCLPSYFVGGNSHMVEKAKQFREGKENIERAMKLHAGDICSLNNELDSFIVKSQDLEDDADRKEKEIAKLLDKIENALGHYSEIGGAAPPYHETDDDTIKESVKKLRKINKG